MRRACWLVFALMAFASAWLLREAPAPRAASTPERAGPRFASSGLHYASTRDGARVDVRIDSAAVERRKVGPFRVRGFDALRLEGVSVGIEGADADAIAVAPLLADALRQLPVRGVASVEIEYLAVAWRPADAAPVQLRATGARARSGPDAWELLRPQLSPGGPVRLVESRIGLAPHSAP